MRPITVVFATWLGASMWLAPALLQAGAETTSSTADPLTALWSLIGSSPVAGLLYFWLRGERAEKKAALEAKEAMVTQLLELIKVDADHKAAIRERLQAQDTTLARIEDSVARMENHR
jgi:hypothetical protein